MPDARLLECRGGPCDGAKVPQSKVDERGNYYEKIVADGVLRGIAAYAYDAGTDCLHFTATARVRNGSAVQ